MSFLDRPVDRTSQWIVLAAIILLALGLRFCHIGTESLQVDEWLTLRDAQHIQDDNRHRPLFYLLLQPWLSLGSGEAWTRAPAIIFGLAAIALLYLLGRRLADVPASVMACLIMAIAVPELNHSQEVRMYTMASILTLASIYLLFSWIESQRLGVLVVHIGVTYLAFLTAPTVIFGLLLAGGMCGVVLVYRRNWTAALAIAIGYGLLLLAWLPLKRYAKLALSYGSLSWVPRPSRSALLLLHGSFFERCRVKSTLLISSRPHPRQINNLSKNGHRSGSVVFRSRAAGA